MISNNVTGAAAYAAVQAGTGIGGTAGSTGSGDNSFGTVMQNAITGLTALGQNADTMSNQALRGNGNMTDVVMAVSKAEMALQASVAVRDKMVSAYQEIMRMSV